MITKLTKSDFTIIKPLLPGLESHPVIFGVIDGNNPGEIYVDNKMDPRTALIWAKNEMFYLCGNLENKEFNLEIEDYIASTIKNEAIQNGEDDLNLELYPNHKWDGTIDQIFHRVQLLKGERVPFTFHKEWFLQSESKEIAEGYEVKLITKELIHNDTSHIVENEIKKFWGPALEPFFEKGFGYAVVQGATIIGTCLSVFITNNEFEIGINTYDTNHRGKGLATSMARAFIDECLSRGVTPHWTTENFRKDSVAIANKLGFEQLPNYTVYYLPFNDFIIE